MKAVLAYSGGLDTSICVRLLQEEYGCDVVTVTVDVGIPEDELKEAGEKARALGAKHYQIDAREEFATQYIFRAIKANGSYEGYPLSTALARPLIARKVVDVARREGAGVLAHGATGKGNDQFRFEAVFRTEAPDMRIIAPIREKNLTRKESIAYAKKHGIEIGGDKPFSIDENLWGRSIEGGVLEDPSAPAPEEIFQWTRVSKKEPETLEIEFQRGLPVAVDGKRQGAVELITALNERAGAHGVGRIDIIEDRIIGLKSRENYECPAAVVLLEAHRDLEGLVLTREELRFKEMVDSRWSELVYRGLWNEPLRAALEAFIEKTQERVTGTVTVELKRGCARVVGRESEHALYSEGDVSFDEAGADGREILGMLRYHAYQAALHRRKPPL
ncbi:MAG: argininosuccinate synthase [Methanobacteriota archaeon]|nr:MAG: argininosuccinate synthase [Euryarchaeota archaeon]